MKCLCGYNQKPENLRTFKIHTDDCLSNGFLSNLSKEPSIVWRNREFVLTDEPRETDKIIEVHKIPAGRKPVEKTTDYVKARWSVESPQPESAKKQSAKKAKKK